jgi:hypothetical protein
MLISGLAKDLGIEIEIAQGNYADRGISSGYASDLLSDVMANAQADGVLVTVQAHKNAVAVASLVGLAAIVVCNSRPLPDDMIESARSEGVAIFRTRETAFEVSGRLWAALNRP